MTDEQTPQEYKDDDLVYVDPDTKTVIGKVEWNTKEQPVSKSYPKAPKKTKKDKDDGPRSWRKIYPWGTYKSMRRQFKLQGKVRDPEPEKTLDEVMDKALKEAFWNS